MPASNHNDDLFSASLESISTSKRVDKFQRFKNDFKRECDATLNNAQEWIKAELPIVTDYIDPALIKDELKQSKTSDRRKYLLSALLFEKKLRDSIESNDATKAAVMTLHMVNHMWLAKVELHGLQPLDSSIHKVNHSETEPHDDARKKILTTIIKKSEKLNNDSQIQDKKSKTIPNKTVKTPVKSSKPNKKKIDTWAEEVENEKKARLAALAKKAQSKNSRKKKTSKKKAASVFSKVKGKIPLRKKTKQTPTNDSSIQDNKYDEELLDDPNRSSIMVKPGFVENIDDSIIQARAEVFNDANESGVKVHKVLKQREHERQEPGSNTIIMKLASSAGNKTGAKLSIPEQCQEAINQLTEQFPGYDLVAIRNMAAEKVGVSPQYIENLNILPEKAG